MGSSFTWLDYSEHERRKMLDVINMFSEKGTRDELGIGAVRDAFADMLFPGTSTVQTRARYLLFIPWMYTKLEQNKVPASKIAAAARKEEIALINALANSDDPIKTIGIQAGKHLQRLPSNIYWLGLRVLGIRLFPGTQDQYHRSLDTFYRSVNKNNLCDDDGEIIAGTSNWHPHLPQPPSDFPTCASFRLRYEDAIYLRERIMTRVPQSLLAFLVDQGELTDPVSFPWQHPESAQFPPHIREQLKHARNFSETIHGAALLYNLMLAEKCHHATLMGHYKARIQQWGNEMHINELQTWNLEQFWQVVTSEGSRISPSTRHFVDTWIKHLLSAKPIHTIMNNQQVRHLIEERECLLKGALAKLTNPHALEMWNGTTGIARLQYRWPTAWQIVSDIQKGLGEEHDAS